MMIMIITMSKTSSKWLLINMLVAFNILTDSMEAVQLVQSIRRRYIQFDQLTLYFRNAKLMQRLTK